MVQEQQTNSQKPEKNGNLKENNQNISDKYPNEFLPKTWRPHSSREKIYEFFFEYFKMKTENPKLNLEIEIRIGQFAFETRQGINGPTLEALVRHLSLQHPIVIGTTHSEIKKTMGMKQANNTAIPYLGHRFNSRVNSDFFFERLDTVKLYKNFHENLDKFTIDFIPQKRKKKTNARLTFDLQSGKYLSSEKLYKENLDIMHQNLDYRVSASFENDTELDRKEFLRQINTNQIGLARVKLRKTFVFQFMEFSFTRCYEVFDKALLKGVLYIVKKDVPEDFEILKGQCLDYIQKISPAHELEVEILDTDFFIKHMEKDPFVVTKLIDRFIRNAENMANWPDKFNFADYRSIFPQNIKVEVPEIGRYLNELKRREKPG